MEFKSHLLTEQKKYFADKVGDILTSVLELLEAGKQLGLRQLLIFSQDLVGQIRKVLHTSWTRSELKYLKVLQKCGVAIMKTIDEKGDIKETLNGCRAEIENVLKKLKVPLNDLK